MNDRDEKTCASCGRRIEWRAKWARNWDEVRYCSDACRRRGVRPIDRELEEELAGSLGSGGMPDVAEAARTVAARHDADAAELAEPVRRAARRLVASGTAEIVQRGRVADPSTAKGAFGIRRAR